MTEGNGSRGTGKSKPSGLTTCSCIGVNVSYAESKGKCAGTLGFCLCGYTLPELHRAQHAAPLRGLGAICRVGILRRERETERGARQRPQVQRLIPGSG